MRRLTKYLQGRRLMVMLMILVGTGNAVAQTGGWLIVRNAIDNGIIAKDTRYLAIAVGLYLAVAAAGWILQAFLIRGLAFSYEAVRDWEAKLTPALAENLRRRRKGKVGRSWYVDETYIRVRGGWRYLYRAIDRAGALVDVMLSEHRDLAAAKAFFRSAKAATGVIPDRVTTDGHDAYPRAIRTELGRHVRHRTSRYLNNRLEQDHRGIKGRCRPMLGLKSTGSARRYCHGHDELRNFMRCRSRMRQHVPAATRRWQHMRRAATALGILETA